MTVEPELVTLPVISIGFPPPPEHEIDRDNILDLFDTLFASEIGLISIEGSEGGGKTTTAAQFTRRHADTAISIFLNNGGWGTDLDSHLHDAAKQIHWILTRHELDAPSTTPSAYRHLLGQLQTRSRKLKETYYFIVDGLDDDSSAERTGFRQSFLREVMPFGYGAFKYLITGDLANFHPLLPRALKTKYHSLPPFSFDETSRYLAALRLPDTDLRTIQRHSGGIPLYLATLRRLLATGNPLSEVMEGVSTELADLFAIEWARVASHGDSTRLALAVLAHDLYPHTSADLAGLVNVEPSALRQDLHTLPFITYDATNDQIGFVSDAFKRYAANAGAATRVSTLGLIIDHLSQTPHSETSLLRLPHEYNQAGRYADLLRYLSPEILTDIAQRTASLSRLTEFAHLGYRTARTISRFPDTVRFALLESVIHDLSPSELDRSEIRALVPLDRYDDALRLAETSPLIEDRLHLLAVVARSCKEHGRDVPPELLRRIRELAETADPRSRRTRALAIASDLVFADVNLAATLLERAAGAEGDPNSLDVAFAQLSLLAAAQPSGPNLQALHSRVHDPALRSFLETASLAVGRASADKVLEQANAIDTPSTRLFLLRLWCRENKERPDALHVVEAALHFTIAATQYSPNATVFLDLAQPLVAAADYRAVRDLISIFDSQKSAIEHLGPTEDAVMLQLTLARAERRIDTRAVRARLTDLYLVVAELTDLAVRANAAAMIATELAVIDPTHDFETGDKLHSSSEDLLVETIDSLRSRTGRHDELFQSVLDTLAPSRPSQAFELARSLNTSVRRDRAYLAFIRGHMTRGQPTPDSLDIIMGAVDSIADEAVRAEAITLSLRALSRSVTVSEGIRALLPTFIAKTDRVRFVDQRVTCRTYAYLLARRYLDSTLPSLSEHLLTVLRSEIGQIDHSWDHSEQQFIIARRLAPDNREAANRFLTDAQTLRRTLTTSGTYAAQRLAYLIQLSIRAWAGLLERRADRPGDLAQIERAIDSIGSDAEYVLHWSEIAIRLHDADRQKDCTGVITDRVYPALARLHDRDVGYWIIAASRAAPALYVGHPITAVEMLRRLPLPQRDDALRAVVHFIFSGRSVLEPVDAAVKGGYDLGFQDIHSIIALVEEMSTDAFIYSIIRDVARSVTAHRKAFSQQQLGDIARRLSEVVEKKLPDANNIRHDGFKICGRAFVEAIRKNHGARLEADIAKIPNESDRSFVYGVVVNTLTGMSGPERSAMIRTALLDIDSIPATLDRAGRLSDFGELVADMDQSLARTCLKRAMESANGAKSTNPALDRRKQEMVDYAYRIDPEFASSLASLSDDDPARASPDGGPQARLLINQARQSLINCNATEIAETARQSGGAERIFEAAWLALGVFNSGRTASVRPEELLGGLDVAVSEGIGNAYPLFAWTIANVVDKYKGTDQVTSILRPLFDGVVGVTGFASDVLNRRMSRASEPGTLSVGEVKESRSIVVREGERAIAEEFLRRWFRDQASRYLKIADPFFGPADLGVLKIVLSERKDLSIQILTSARFQTEAKIVRPWEDAYRAAWNTLCEGDPPETEIVVVGFRVGGDSPIHDRWVLSERSGLRLGTSFNSIGTTKVSEISQLSEGETLQRESQVDQYLSRSIREHNGKALTYLSFTL